MSASLQRKLTNTINNDTAQESRTFLRWLNSKLRTRDKQLMVTNIQADLCDGLILVELVEILSCSKIGNKFTKIESKLRHHHLDRITLVLEYMRSHGVEMFMKIGECTTFEDRKKTISFFVGQFLDPFVFSSAFPIRTESNSTWRHRCNFICTMVIDLAFHCIKYL